MQPRRIISCAIAGWLLSVSVGQTAEWGLKEGAPAIKTASALAFGPDGILFVGDAKSAAIFAIGTGDTKGDAGAANINITGLNLKIAETLGTTAENIAINDLAVNPMTGRVFVAVAKGKGADATAAIIQIDSGKLTEVSLKKIPFLQAVLPDAPEDKEVTRGGRTQNPRNESITDLAYAEGKVFVSGTAAAAAPSSVHQIPFPFSDGVGGASVEIYHAAHARSEDNATIRTFIPLNINGEPSLLAGFTCTPLVRFPIDSLKPGTKTKGTTVAELGNRNKPLDMIAYQKDGKTFLLMSNSARGVMKISTENIAENKGLTTPVGGGGTAGQPFETVKELTEVTQLDKLNDTHAVILVTAGNSQDLRTISLP
ncbi:MAG: hypothetical protein JSS49_08245 [Planctomycetes bacterium]|nr:hypothetical protein [Planctomycetota bacterium]